MFFLQGCDYFLVLNFLTNLLELNVSVCMEILFTYFSNLQKSLQRILGNHRFQFCLLNFSVILLCLLIENRSAISHILVFLFLKFVSQSFSQSALSIRFAHFLVKIFYYNWKVENIITFLIRFYRLFDIDNFK